MHKIKKYLLLALLFIGNAYANTPVSTGFINDVAIGGYDTTAYFQQQAATEGNKEYTVKYNGASWRFVSQQQADMFAANPEKYMPQYGGYCSNALAQGEGLIKTDGTVWYIFGDNLHLFYAKRGLDKWLNGDYEALKAQADLAWQAQLASK